jgi:hypothetical protein
MSAQAALKTLLPLLPPEETLWLHALLVRDYGESIAIFNPQAFVLQKPLGAMPWPEQAPTKPWASVRLYLRASQALSIEEIAWLENFKIFFAALELYIVFYPGEDLLPWARWQLFFYLRKKIAQHWQLPCRIQAATVSKSSLLRATRPGRQAWRQQQQRALLFYCQKYRQTTENPQSATAKLQAIEEASTAAFAQLSSRLMQLHKNQPIDTAILSWQQDLSYQALVQTLKNSDIPSHFPSLIALANQYLHWQKQPRWRLERHKKSRFSLKNPWGLLQEILKQGERLFQALLFSTLVGMIAWAVGIDHGLLLTFILLSALALGWRFQLKKTTSYTLAGRDAFLTALKQSWQTSISFQKIQTLALWEQSCPPTSTMPNAKP